MRYVNLTVTNPTTGKTMRQWNSYPNGLNAAPDPGALNIEFDVFVAQNGTPIDPGGSAITIEGVPLADLFQAQQFTGMAVSLSAGMGPGLPLAKPAQAGLILAGTVFQSFGNWVGTEMSLDFVVQGSQYTIDEPGNFTVNWPAGSPLGAAVAITLATAFPTTKINATVSSSAVLPNTEYGQYSTLRQFAGFVQGLTQGLVSDAYPGITICYQGGQFYVYDGTQTPLNVQLAFADLVGQPTWIQPNTVQVTTVMRADIQVGNTVTFPAGLQSLPGIATTTSSSMSGTSKYQSSFQGVFEVAAVRHNGNLRSPNGLDWVSVFNCVAQVVNG